MYHTLQNGGGGAIMKLFKAVGRYLWWWGSSTATAAEKVKKATDDDASVVATLREWIERIANEGDGTFSTQEMADVIDYVVWYKRSAIDDFPVLARMVQDRLIYFAARDGVFLEPQFEALFGYSLRDVMARTVDIQPGFAAVDNVREFTAIMSQYFAYNHEFRGRARVQEVFLVQMVNFVAENIAIVRRHTRFYQSFQRKMQQFQREHQFTISWLEEFMRVQDRELWEKKNK